VTALLLLALLGAEDPGLKSTGFDAFTATDKLDRKIAYYLERADAKPLPLVVILGGSGCESVWAKRGDKVSGRFQNVVRAIGKGRVRTMTVEKPGVPLFNEGKVPGTALECPKAFLEEHTLDRWAEAVSAAIADAVTRPGVDKSRVLIIGHSEGGISAAAVAAKQPLVTHVASLASNGPSQLYDFALLDGDNGERVYKEFAAVQADPLSIEKFWRGHPHRRWSTFMGTSTLEQLLRSKAKVFLAHGTKDTAVPVAAFDILKAELTARGRSPQTLRVEGADHGFNGGPWAKSDLPPISNVFRAAIDWALAN
jgi:pimeloyl-ACP methyl ester carboxylesterase